MLGKDRKFDINETYPVVRRKELLVLMDRVNAQPEYVDGGKMFKMYKADGGYVELALVEDEHVPSLTPPVGTVIKRWAGAMAVPKSKLEWKIEVEVKEQCVQPTIEESPV